MKTPTTCYQRIFSKMKKLLLAILFGISVGASEPSPIPGPVIITLTAYDSLTDHCTFTITGLIPEHLYALQQNHHGLEYSAGPSGVWANKELWLAENETEVHELDSEYHEFSFFRVRHLGPE